MNQDVMTVLYQIADAFVAKTDDGEWKYCEGDILELVDSLTIDSDVEILQKIHAISTRFYEEDGTDRYHGWGCYVDEVITTLEEIPELYSRIAKGFE